MNYGSTILPCVTIFVILKQCLIRAHCSIVTAFGTGGCLLRQDETQEGQVDVVAGCRAGGWWHALESQIVRYYPRPRRRHRRRRLWLTHPPLLYSYFRPRKDIYQRIYIYIYPISYPTIRKKDSPLSFFWVGYVEGYNILFLGIYNFLYPPIAILLQRPVCFFWRADFHGQGNCGQSPWAGQ
jgi:hypothetical protein